MGRWMNDDQVGGWINGLMDALMDVGCIGGLMDAWMMNGWIDG